MKDTLDLEEFYQTNIKANLASLETSRKKLLSNYSIGIAGFVIAIGLFIGISISGISSGFALFLLPLAFIIGAIIIMVKSGKSSKMYRSEYKSRIVSEIVKLIDPNLTYDASQMISTVDYSNSDLFRTPYDKYKGDDFISGVIDKTDFQCSELHTEYKRVSSDSDGKRKEEWVTIFKGLFFHADFNKEFKGRTYVSPDTAEKIFGKFGQKFQKLSGKAKLVKLENLEFEKEFVVHSTNQIEARYILTPKIMEAILRIKGRYNRPMHFAFIGTRVYCAISFNKKLFEPRVFKSGVKYADIESMYHLFLLNKTIIQELNLNLRIWTKD